MYDYNCDFDCNIHISVAMVVATIVIYICVLLGIALMYAFFTEVKQKRKHQHSGYMHAKLKANTRQSAKHSIKYIFFNGLFHQQVGGCSLNVFFITSTLIFSVVVSVVAILPWVQRGKHMERFTSPCLYISLLSLSLSLSQFSPNLACFSLLWYLATAHTSHGLPYPQSLMAMVLTSQPLSLCVCIYMYMYT